MADKLTDRKTLTLMMLAVCHLLVDGVSAAVILGQDGGPLLVAVLVYDTCAFTTQCVVGMLPDRIGHGKELVLVSAVVIAFGVLLPVPIMIKAIVVGLGNSLFHVSGGYITLKGSQSMGPLGVFVAPGAIGLFIGTVFPKVRLLFTAALVVMAELIILACDTEDDEDDYDPDYEDDFESDAKCVNTGEQGFDRGEAGTATRAIPDGERILLAGMLLIAVAARAVGGSAVTYPWKTGIAAGAMLVFAVFLGKALGGVIADRVVIRPAAVVSVAAASVLLVFFSSMMAPSLIGQFALNISMPITLYLIYQLFPDRPGFAFGLAASALWPGTLIGKLIHLTGVWAGMLTVICFMAGLAAVCIVDARLQKVKAPADLKES